MEQINHHKIYRRTANNENAIKSVSSHPLSNAKSFVGYLAKQPTTTTSSQLSSSTNTGFKRSALSTLTNTSAATASTVPNGEKHAPATGIKASQRLFNLSTITRTVSSEAKKPGLSNTLQRLTGRNPKPVDDERIFSDAAQVKQPRKLLLQQQQNHYTTTRPKQTFVWTDKEDANYLKESDKYALDASHDQKNVLSGSTLSSLIQQPLANAGHLKRKIYSAHGDDTEPDEEDENVRSTQVSHIRRNGEYRTSNDAATLMFHRSNATTRHSASSNTSGSTYSSNSKSTRSRKSKGTPRYPQKNKKVKQQSRSIDVSAESSAIFSKINNLHDWPYDRSSSKKGNGDGSRSSTGSGTNGVVSHKKTEWKYEYPVAAEYKSQQFKNNFDPSKGAKFQILVNNERETIFASKSVNVDESPVEDLEALSSESEVVLPPRDHRKKPNSDSDHTPGSSFERKQTSDVLFDTPRVVEEPSFDDLPIPEHPYQVTIASQSKTNPYAVFPVWDAEALSKMKSVCKFFDNAPGIFDADDEDSYDISMVAEYSNEIFDYMRKLEFKYRPDADYMDRQSDIDWNKRGILVDWLVRVHSHCKLLPETLFLTINYIDRFLSLKEVEQSNFQLVGITALLIASKYEEITFPSVQELVNIVENTYSFDDILRAERYMIDMLEFNMGWPGPMSFLRRSSKADDYDSETRTVAKYFLELTIMDQRFVGSQPSWLAAASHCLSLTMLGKGPWSDLHVYFGGYTKKQLQPAIDIMIEACKKPLTHHKAIYTKYSEEHFKWVSIHVDNWIYQTYGVDTCPS